MNRYAQLSNNIVQIVIESETDPDGINGEWIACDNQAGPGWTYNQDGAFTAPIHTEPRKVILTHYEYMNRFTMDELRAIYTAAKTIVDIEIWLDKFKMAQEVNLDDPETIDGLNKMETFQLIGVGRSSEIRGL